MQKTLRSAVETSGVGLHTGFTARMRLVPAPPDTGIVFRRTDLNDYPIPAIKQFVSKVSYATSLMRQGVLIATVEHLLSALRALEVDNVFVDVDTMEIPIMDGSARPFVEMIDSAGVADQDRPRQLLRLLRPIRVEADDKWIEAEPAECFEAHYSIHFPHPLIEHQERRLRVDPAAYRREICGARTFGFFEELDTLKKAGLIKGGSLDNAIVLNRHGLMNPGLRFPDEFVRHKILDLVGDLALIGKPVLASVRAHRAGHALHISLTNQILRQPECYEVCTEAPQAEAVMQGTAG